LEKEQWAEYIKVRAPETLLKRSATYKGEPVVVKTIHSHLVKQYSEVFVREALITCSLAAHPNVVTALGYHPENHILCLGKGNMNSLLLLL
jgi:hypothetical protein